MKEEQRATVPPGWAGSGGIGGWNDEQEADMQGRVQTWV
jgi:hypothetical protein